MVLGFDDVSATTLVDTTETLLNAGTPLTTPNNAQQILEVSPYICSVGVGGTTDESVQPFFRIQSDDVAVEPKICSLPVIDYGDGAFTAVFGSPLMPTWPMNIPLAEQSRINYFGDLDEAVTVDPKLAVTVVYSDQASNMPEYYYQRGATSTQGGTVDNTRTAGADITITGGAEIVMLINTIGVTTSVLNDQINGFHEYASSDFQTSFPYRVQVTQAFASIDALSSIDGGAGIKIFKMPIGQGIPIAGRTVISTFYTQRDTMAVGCQFNHCVGYIK